MTLFDLLEPPRSLVRLALEELCPQLVKTRVFAKDNCSLVLTAVTGIIETVVHQGHGGLICFVPKSHLGAVESEKGKYRIALESRDLVSKAFEEVATQDRKLFTSLLSSTQQKQGPEESGGLSKAEEDLITRQSADWERERFNNLTENVALLACVDNALVIGPELQIIAAGFHVTGQLAADASIWQVAEVDGTVKSDVLFPLERYGARHRAAAIFAHQYSGSVVFVCSEDGALRCLHRNATRPAEIFLWELLGPVEL